LQGRIALQSSGDVRDFHRGDSPVAARRLTGNLRESIAMLWNGLLNAADFRHS